MDMKIYVRSQENKSNLLMFEAEDYDHPSHAIYEVIEELCTNNVLFTGPVLACIKGGKIE